MVFSFNGFGFIPSQHLHYFSAGMAQITSRLARLLRHEYTRSHHINFLTWVKLFHWRYSSLLINTNCQIYPGLIIYLMVKLHHKEIGK